MRYFYLLFILFVGIVNFSCQTEGRNDGQIIGKRCQASEDLCLSETELSYCDEDGRRKLRYCAAGEFRYAGICGPVVCEAGKISHCLESGQYLGCNPVGTGETSLDCPQQRTCVDNACVPRTCLSGEGVCADNDRILMCNEAGTAFTVEKSCREENPRTSCVEGACISLCEQNSKNANYIGCEYWAVDLDNAIDAGVYNAAGQPFAIVLSNTRDDISANVSIYEKKSYASNPPKAIMRFEIPARELRKVYLPDGCYDGGAMCEDAFRVNGTNISESAYFIQSDLPITAAQFNPLDNVNVFSNDASLLLPTSAVGRRYMVMSRQQHYESFHGFASIVAIEPGKTKVEFKASCKTLAGRDKSGKPIPAMQRGQTQSFILEQFDVLNIETGGLGEDLTGSEISADRNIAVFAGNEATSVPETQPVTCCADHLEQQLYPIQSWGKSYNAVRTKPRNKEREMWRILARQDNTTVETTPKMLDRDIVLNSGEWIDILTDKSFDIEASAPISLGQFTTSQYDPLDEFSFKPTPASAGTGDPCFILGVPIEQYRTHYSFLVPSKYAKNFITIVAEKGTSVVLDEKIIPETEFVEFGSGRYVYAWVDLEEGRHFLEASKAVGLFVYGFDRAVAYGYPAGLDLKALFDE